MKAMILAAGRGARMRPITDQIPKPLVPIAGKPAIVHQILKLADIGIQDIVINVSYLAQQIIETLGDGQSYGVKIEYSLESKVLETGGGILKALPLLGDDPFLVLSADIWTDYPMETLFQCLSATAQAHLVLVDNPSFHTQGDFHLNNNFLTLNDLPKLTFAGFGIFHPSFFEKHKSDAFPLSELLVKRISEKKVTGEYYSGTWFNVGTLEELKRLEQYLTHSTNSRSLTV